MHLDSKEKEKFLLPKCKTDMADVKIYTTPTCHYCHMAKEYFTEKGITYQEYDVSKDSAARTEMVEKSGQMGVPVILIDGNMIIGFDRGKVEQLLQK